jgi:hypothetical protein
VARGCFEGEGAKGANKITSYEFKKQKWRYETKVNAKQKKAMTKILDRMSASGCEKIMKILDLRDKPKALWKFLQTLSADEARDCAEILKIFDTSSKKGKVNGQA